MLLNLFYDMNILLNILLNTLYQYVYIHAINDYL